MRSSVTGADPYSDDRLGKLTVTKEGLLKRDLMVLEECRDSGIPIAVTMVGGYARDVRDTVGIHFQTVSRVAALLRSEPSGKGRR